MDQVDQGGEEYLTVAEVAELLKLNQQTVRNWIEQGSMPAIRLGRRVRIKRSDLDRVIARGYQGAEGGQDATGPEDAGLPGPSASDFWGGEPVGTADPATSDHATSDHATNEPATNEPVTDQPATSDHATKDHATNEEPINENATNN